ncbi:MAG: HXXEE domain-containing protein [Caldilineaceae bacterium]
MNVLRQHWFDIGFVLALIVGAFLIVSHVSPLSWLLWGSLLSLFLHQFEEYRYPGYFPGMMNVVMFGSKQPDRYPLNANTALLVNVAVGWLSYLLAALFGETLLWLGIATMLVSVGNVVAHTLLFNILGKTFYNPGLLTALLLFLPIVVYFCWLVIQNNLATPLDWGVGLVLGLALNYVGILKLIDWRKDENTQYIFPKRSLLPETRNH